jgi:VWFA-related protein
MCRSCRAGLKARPSPVFLVASIALAVSAAVLSIDIAAQQQPPQPVFRTTTRLIVQTVTVKDKQGNVVEGLTAKDFTVTEDGVPQDIAFVEFQRLAAVPDPAAPAPGAPPGPGAPPLQAAPPAAGVAPVTQTEISASAPGDIRYRDRRLIVLYFDTSAMPPPDMYRAQVHALRFIDTQMSPADLVAIIAHESGAVRVKHDFTANKAALREVIEIMIFGEDADGDGIRDQPDQSSAFGQAGGEFNVFNTDRQLAALQTAVTMLRPLAEQKALIYFASGLRLNGADNQAQLRATINAAIRANVSIHAIDARGLVATAPLGDATQRSPGGIGMFTGRLAEATMSNFQRSQDTLYALAKDTGGSAMFDYNDLSLGIVRAAQSITSYYIVGYYSTHTAADGRFRRVRVSLNGSREADLTFRAGYFAEKEWGRFTEADKERQLEEALMLENPITDVTIAMELNYFRLNSAEYFVPVAVKIPGSELALARRGGAARTRLDFIGEVKDEYGVTYSNMRDRIDITIDDRTAEELTSGVVQYDYGFTLLPGKYVVKFLVRDAVTGRIGTYQTAFTIPNLDRELKRLPISTVVLSSQRVPLSEALHTVEQKIPSDTAHPLIHGDRKLLPSVTRVFSRSRDMYVYLQAYQQKAVTTQPLVAFVTFYRGEEKAFETIPLAVTDGLQPRSKAVPLQFSVPLESFPTGRYDVQVSVLEPAGQKVAFWRAPIVVVE